MEDGYRKTLIRPLDIYKLDDERTKVDQVDQDVKIGFKLKTDDEMPPAKQVRFSKNRLVFWTTRL